MSLLNRIQTKLAEPVPQAPEPENVIDIDQRDEFIRGCMGADYRTQIDLAKRMQLNEATLTAAIKILCRYPDPEIRRRLGIAEQTEPELFTAKEWSAKSQFPTGDTRRQNKTHR